MSVCIEKDISVMINLNAGSSSIDLVSQAEEISCGYPAIVYATCSLAGMMQRVHRDLEAGVKLQVIYGGDGTLAAVVNEVRKYLNESPELEAPSIAYIPAGTGNILKPTIGINKLKQPLESLLQKYQNEEELPIMNIPLVNTEYIDLETGENKSMLYTTAGTGLDAELLQDFEEVCRGKSGLFSKGLLGYMRSIFGKTVWKQGASLFKPELGEVKIKVEGPAKMVEVENKEESYQEFSGLVYQGPTSKIHSVFVGSHPNVGFGITGFPHLKVKDQYLGDEFMQARIVKGDKLKMLGHLILKTPTIVTNNFRNSPYISELLIPKGGEIITEFDRPVPLQVAGGFVAEACDIKYKREEEMSLINWAELIKS